jgi:hypothetical protein
MGTLDAGAAIIHGLFDRFDRCNALVLWLENTIRAGDDEIELHAPSEEDANLMALFGREVKPHFVNRKEMLLAELERARQLINEACQICQNVMAES